MIKSCQFLLLGKNLKSCLFLFLFLFLTTILSAQFKIETGAYTNWYVDNHGNAFVQSDNRILKITSSGEVVARWNSPKSNRITSFDARDHLRVLVFYQESYLISVLDKNLVEIIKPIDLQVSGLNDIVVMCQAVNGGFWAADRQTNSIYALQNNLSLVYSFSFSRFGHVSEIRKMLEYDQTLWFLMNDNSWLVLDLFGQLYGRHAQPGLENAQITKSTVHYIHDALLYSYNIALKDVKNLNKECPEAQHCFLYKDKLYLFGKNSLEIVP